MSTFKDIVVPILAAILGDNRFGFDFLLAEGLAFI